MVNTIADFFVISDNAGVAFYWSTPIGFVSIFAIFICSLYRIFYTQADFVNSLCNWIYVLICGVAFLHIHENSNPRHQMMVLVTTLAVSKVWALRGAITHKGVDNG